MLGIHCIKLIFGYLYFSIDLQVSFYNLFEIN